MKTLNRRNLKENQINFVVIYHDVNDNPEAFEYEIDAIEWMKSEKKFGDYDMSLITYDEFKNFN